MSPAAGKPGTGTPAPETDEPVQDAAVPPVALVPWGEGSSGVVLQPGADVADVEAALARIPGRLVFTEAFGDVDVVLVFEVAPDLSRRQEAGAGMRALATGQHDGPRDGQRWTSAGERTAYRAGWDEALAQVRRTVLGASGAPDGLVPDPGPAADRNSDTSGASARSASEADRG